MEKRRCGSYEPICQEVGEMDENSPDGVEMLASPLRLRTVFIDVSH